MPPRKDLSLMSCAYTGNAPLLVRTQNNKKHSNNDSRKELKRNTLSDDAHDNSCCKSAKQATPCLSYFLVTTVDSTLFCLS